MALNEALLLVTAVAYVIRTASYGEGHGEAPRSDGAGERIEARHEGLGRACFRAYEGMLVDSMQQ